MFGLIRRDVVSFQEDRQRFFIFPSLKTWTFLIELWRTHVDPQDTRPVQEKSVLLDFKKKYFFFFSLLKPLNSELERA
jgi:hypothetical protein